MSNRQEQLDLVVRLIAHDLRNPLTAMQLNAQLIERAAASDGREREQRWAAFIATAARRMDGMIQLLVEAERIRSGRIELGREELSVAAWLDTWRAGAKLGFDLARVQVSATDPALIIVGDARRLQQALTALVDMTGRAAADDASVTLEVQREAGALRLRVRAPRAGAAGTTDKEDPVIAGHGIESHHLQAVIEQHGGQVRFSFDDDLFGFDVMLPAQP